jgi:hypothetical protein
MNHLVADQIEQEHGEAALRAVDHLYTLSRIVARGLRDAKALLRLREQYREYIDPRIVEAVLMETGNALRSNLPR